MIVVRALILLNFHTQNLNKLAELVRGEMPKLSRRVIGALITIDVHARDIVTQMVTNQVKCVGIHVIVHSERLDIPPIHFTQTVQTHIK